MDRKQVRGVIREGKAVFQQPPYPSPRIPLCVLPSEDPMQDPEVGEEPPPRLLVSRETLPPLGPFLDDQPHYHRVPTREAGG
jgi:hypothetical protein